MQAEASTSALAFREEQVGQLQEQVQQADCQVAHLQQAQSSIAADAAAKASKLAHLEGAAICDCWLVRTPLSENSSPRLLLGTEALIVMPHSNDSFLGLFLLWTRSFCGYDCDALRWVLMGACGKSAHSCSSSVTAHDIATGWWRLMAERISPAQRPCFSSKTFTKTTLTEKLESDSHDSCKRGSVAVQDTGVCIVPSISW